MSRVRMMLRMPTRPAKRAASRPPMMRLSVNFGGNCRKGKSSSSKGVCVLRAKMRVVSSARKLSIERIDVSALPHRSRSNCF